MGFLWADLGSWCLDKASDFPARNVHSPKETANRRKGEREKEGEEREKQSGREKEEGKDNRGKEKEMGVAEVEEKEMSVEVVWVERKTEREQ